MYPEWDSPFYRQHFLTASGMTPGSALTLKPHILHSGGEVPYLHFWQNDYIVRTIVASASESEFSMYRCDSRQKQGVTHGLAGSPQATHLWP